MGFTCQGEITCENGNYESKTHRHLQKCYPSLWDQNNSRTEDEDVRGRGSNDVSANKVKIVIPIKNIFVPSPINL